MIQPGEKVVYIHNDQIELREIDNLRMAKNGIEYAIKKDGKTLYVSGKEIASTLSDLGKKKGLDEKFI